MKRSRRLLAGGGDEQGVIKTIQVLQDDIVETDAGDIANGGQIIQSIRTYG